MTKRLKWAIGIVSLLVVFVSSIEIAMWLADGTEYFIHRPHQTITLYPAKEGLEGFDETVNITFNSLGIRGEEPFVGSSNFLAVGSSTTIQYMQGDEKMWATQLRNILAPPDASPGMWIGAAGRPRLALAENFLHLEYLLPKLHKLDVVLLMVGYIDAGRALLQPGKSLKNRNSLRHNAFTVRPRRKLVWPGHPNSYVYRYVQRIPLKLFGDKAFLTMVDHPVMLPPKEMLISQRATSPIIDTSPDIAEFILLYKMRRHALAELAESYEALPVFITQPTMISADMPDAEKQRITFGKINSKKDADGVAPYYSVRVLNETLNLFNAATLEVCRERALACVDLNAVMPKEQSFYLDDVHFTNSGTRKAAELIAKGLVEQKVIIQN